MRFLRWSLVGALVSAALAADYPPPPPPAADPDIRQIVSEISGDRIERSIIVLASFNTRNTLSDPAPSGNGIGAAGAWIRTQFEKLSARTGGRIRVEVDRFMQPMVISGSTRSVDIVNIAATLPGSRPDAAERRYVVCAHYDSRASDPFDAVSPAPGADDDGSGVAAVLECAQVLSQYRFPATLVFLVTSGEEQGLLGSTHWARKARERDLDIQAMLDDDTIGCCHGPHGKIERGTVRLFAPGIPASPALDPAMLALIRAGGQNDTPARELARAAPAIARVYVPSLAVRVVFRADPYGRESDHLPFAGEGYPAVRFTEPLDDVRRLDQDVRIVRGVRYGDLTDFMDYLYAANVARVNAAVLAELARAPAPPARVRIDIRRPAAPTLRWAADSDPYLAGYRVVWRDTLAPFWEHHLDVRRGRTEVVLPASPDDALFGVEAFDLDGRVSQAAFASDGPQS
ncbi:MAG: M20/M25/M40 family metallo-hydrolase [Opitutaceae bacterium]